MAKMPRKDIGGKMRTGDKEFIYYAALYSRAAHNAVGQKRKYTFEPYYEHCYFVSDIVQTVTKDADMIAAALLHDILEDTQTTFQEIEDCFDSVVAGYVYELTDQFTDPSLGNREQRKVMEANRLATVSPNAQTIKYADLIDNISSIVKHDKEFAKVYLVEKRNILDVMDKGDMELRERAYQVLAEAEKEVFGE